LLRTLVIDFDKSGLWSDDACDGTGMCRRYRLTRLAGRLDASGQYLQA